MGVDYTTYGRKEITGDVFVAFLMLAGFYGVFAGMLFLVSFVLVNIWETTWIAILLYAIIPAVICELFYVLSLVKKRKKEIEMREYTQRKE